ncbi:MAG: glycosyltransferase family 2 protein [Ancrocorticia sp.]
MQMKDEWGTELKTNKDRVSVIIPTLNAGAEIVRLLDALDTQSLRPDEVIVIDSHSDDDTLAYVRQFSWVTVMEIERSSFDHGGTRHQALMASSGDFVLFLTQDALPEGSDYVASLLEPFADPDVAMVYGRQLPKPDARRFEQLVREFNYPKQSTIREESDIDSLGIKAFFASDVCSAYRRSHYLAVDGFPRPCNTNEDMLIAAKILRDSKKIAYAADARVFHSHNLTPAEQFRRNREVGIFLARNGDYFDGVSEVSEGGTLVRQISRTLLSEKRVGEFLAFGVDCGARLIGNRYGRLVASR